MNEQQNALDLRVEAIQYFPKHRCPSCSALATTDERGSWYIPFQDLFGSALKGWEPYFGYVRFSCACAHKPGPGLRVARLGDALIPLAFEDYRAARQMGLDADVFNARRVAQAVGFLAQNADPSRTAGQDALRLTLIAVASGAVGPDEAYGRIGAWISGGPIGDLQAEIPTEMQQA
jgi:hypothetical protein